MAKSKTPLKAKRCSEPRCDKVIRYYNKSGLCGLHYRKRRDQNKYTKLKRICSKCDNLFTPTGPYCKICPKCQKPKGTFLQELYEKQQQKLKLKIAPKPNTSPLPT